MNMSRDIFLMYVEGMMQINSEEMLEKYTASSFAKMTEDSRKSLHKKTYRRAFPNEFSNPRK